MIGPYALIDCLTELSLGIRDCAGERPLPDKARAARLCGEIDSFVTSRQLKPQWLSRVVGRFAAGIVSRLDDELQVAGQDQASGPSQCRMTFSDAIQRDRNLLVRSLLDQPFDMLPDAFGRVRAAACNVPMQHIGVE